MDVPGIVGGRAAARRRRLQTLSPPTPRIMAGEESGGSGRVEVGGRRREQRRASARARSERSLTRTPRFPHWRVAGRARPIPHRRQRAATIAARVAPFNGETFRAPLDHRGDKVKCQRQEAGVVAVGRVAAPQTCGRGRERAIWQGLLPTRYGGRLALTDRFRGRREPSACPGAPARTSRRRYQNTRFDEGEEGKEGVKEPTQIEQQQIRLQGRQTHASMHPSQNALGLSASFSDEP